MNDKEQTEVVKAELLEKTDQLTAKQEEVKVLKFRVSNFNTEKEVAQQEIERLNADIDKVGTQEDPMWVEMCDMKSQLTAKDQEIEQLRADYKHTREYADALSKRRLEVYTQLTAANKEIERILRSDHTCTAVEYYDLWNAERAKVQERDREIVLTNEARTASAKEIKQQFDQLAVANAKVEKLRESVHKATASVQYGNRTVALAMLQQVLADTEAK